MDGLAALVKLITKNLPKHMADNDRIVVQPSPEEPVCGKNQTKYVRVPRPLCAFLLRAIDLFHKILAKLEAEQL